MPYKDKEKQRAAQREYARQHAAENYKRGQDGKARNIKWLQELKAKSCCQHCPENHPGCLDFHHREGQEKENCVSILVHSGYSLRRIKEEVAKCIILCANCHRKLHWEQKRVTSNVC